MFSVSQAILFVTWCGFIYAEHCSQTLKFGKGQLQSPGYDVDAYPDGLNCQYLFDGKSETFYLLFDEIFLRNNTDSITVKQGNDVLFDVTGYAEPRLIIGSLPGLQISFVSGKTKGSSDSKDISRRFLFSYNPGDCAVGSLSTKASRERSSISLPPIIYSQKIKTDSLSCVLPIGPLSSGSNGASQSIAYYHLGFPKFNLSQAEVKIEGELKDENKSAVITTLYTFTGSQLPTDLMLPVSDSDYTTYNLNLTLNLTVPDEQFGFTVEKADCKTSDNPLKNVTSTYRLVSPDFPQLARPGQKCYWVLSAPLGNTLQAKLTSFHLSDDFAHIELRDGPSSASPLIQFVDKQTNYDNFFSTSSRHLWVHFASPESRFVHGFQLDVTAVPYVGRYYNSSGDITPPVNSSVIQLIAEPGKRALVTTSYAAANVSNAMLAPFSFSIYDGFQNTSNLLYSFQNPVSTSKILPSESIYSPGDKMMLVVDREEDLTNDANLTFTFSSTEPTDHCQLHFSDQSGVIMMPSGSDSADTNISTCSVFLHPRVETDAEASAKNISKTMRIQFNNQIGAEPVILYSGQSTVSPLLLNTATTPAVQSLTLPPFDIPVASGARLVFSLPVAADNSTLQSSNNVLATYSVLPACSSNMVLEAAGAQRYWTSPMFPSYYPMNSVCSLSIDLSLPPPPENSTIPANLTTYPELLLITVRNFSSAPKHVLTVYGNGSNLLGRYEGSRLISQPDLIVNYTKLKPGFIFVSPWVATDSALPPLYSGFNVSIETLTTGGVYNGLEGSVNVPLQTPDEKVTGVWIIDLNQTAHSVANKSLLTLASELSFGTSDSSFWKKAKLEIHDGGSLISPVIFSTDDVETKKDQSIAIQSSMGQLLVRYHFDPVSSDWTDWTDYIYIDDSSVTFKLKWKAKECTSLCDSGKRCNLAEWRCDGLRQCSDGSDEQNCVAASGSPSGKGSKGGGGVSTVVFILTIFVVACLAVAATIFGPVVYHKIRGRNYDQLITP